MNYVGYKLTRDGLKATDERVRAIQNMKPPTNVKELETVLGMIAYIARFILNLSELTSPLRALKKEETWKWTSVEQEAYDAIKKELTSKKVLKYYNVNKPLLLSVDSSNKGLGAAIIQDSGVVAYPVNNLRWQMSVLRQSNVSSTLADVSLTSVQRQFNVELTLD